MGANDCEFVSKGPTEEEVIRKMQNHMMAEHPDKWAEMEQMTDEEKEKMTTEMKAKMEDV